MRRLNCMANDGRVWERQTKTWIVVWTLTVILFRFLYLLLGTFAKRFRCYEIREIYIYVNIERFISSYICLCIFTLSLSKNLSSDCANCAQVFYAYWPTVYNQQSNNAIKTHIDHNRHCAQTDNFLAYHARCARTLRQFVLYHLFWKHIQWWWNDLSVRTHVIILFSLDTHSLAHTHCCLCTLNESIKNQNITKSSSTFQTK